MIFQPSLHFGMCGDDVIATARVLNALDIGSLLCDVEQIPGRISKGRLTSEDLRAFQATFSEVGVSVNAVTLGWLWRDDSGALPEADSNRLCDEIAILGAEGVPIVQVFEAGKVPPDADCNAHRAHVYASYALIVDSCAAAGVRLAIHGFWDTDCMLANTQSYLDLFAAVPDAANGLCFCAGSIYQAGDDPVTAIHRLDSRIHLVHFRDASIVGGECETLLLGNGRVDFREISRVLARVGYDGPVHCEHFATPEYEAAWAAGFMRALFAFGGL